MIHPVFSRFFSQPGLFAEHAGAYAQLATAEIQALGVGWRRKLVWGVATALLGLTSVVVSTMAALLAAAIAADAMPAPWVLWAMPAVFWLATAWCAWATARNPKVAAFSLLLEQLEADARLLDQADQA